MIDSPFCGVQKHVAVQFPACIGQLWENLLVAGEFTITVDLPSDAVQEWIEPVETEQKLINPFVQQIFFRDMNQLMVEDKLILGQHTSVVSGLWQDNNWAE